MPWPIVTTEEERAERERHVAQLVDERIVAVRYFDQDYLHEHEGSAPREASPAEWDDPPWSLEECDQLWYGLELGTAGDSTFLATWETGFLPEFESYEGFIFRQGSLTEITHYEVAWSVEQRSRWTQFLDQPIAATELCWYTYGPSMLCCYAAVLHFGSSPVYITIGQDSLGHGPEDIAVVFDAEVARAHSLGPFSSLSAR